MIGHNTDVPGFRDFLLRDAGINAAGRSALVLGSGGAARAVVAVLSELGVEQIAIAARDPQKVGAIVNLGPGGATRAIEFDDAERAAAASDIVVNATPLGMKGEQALSAVEWRRGQVVCDLVYAPPVTPVMKAAQEAGAEAYGGLGMLIHQAAAAFNIWTGRKAPVATMSAAALRALRSS